MKRVIIIGGGAAGMSCALTAARNGCNALILEGEKRSLRKLAASGNGRGNLMNRGEPRYYGDEDFAKAVLSYCTPKEVEAFWESIGVPLSEENGRVYPSSFSAPAAADALRLAVWEAGVECRCNCFVVSVQKKPKGMMLRCEERIYADDVIRKNGKKKSGELLEKKTFDLECDALVLCCGGKAAPEFGTDGSGYHLAASLGHHVTEIRPALCALTCHESFPSSLLGQRAKAGLRLMNDQGECVAESEGEILFSDHAVSGIAAMQLARFVPLGRILRIDLTRSLCGDSFSGNVPNWLEKRKKAFPGRSEKELLCGAATKAMAGYLAMEKGLPALADRISALTIPLSGCRDFSAAQVTAGGLECGEWDERSMESKLCPGLYAAGEILNVDGDCGGYNLLFAAASGILCGKAVSASKDES